MQVTYIPERDILSIRFGQPKGRLADRELNADVHLEVDESGKIVGMEILSASTVIELREVFPVSYAVGR